MSNYWQQTPEEREKEKKIKAELMDRYPLLYHYARRPGQHSMQYGLGIGMGWIPMIEEMSAKIEPILEKIIEADPKAKFPTAVQVKEKFGGLRFYLSTSHKEVDDIVNDYESKSYEICQDCGESGTIRTKGWHKVLCDSCEQKQNR